MLPYGLVFIDLMKFKLEITFIDNFIDGARSTFHSCTLERIIKDLKKSRFS